MKTSLLTALIFLATLSTSLANQTASQAPSYDRFGRITPSEVYDLWLGINKESPQQATGYLERF